ncbi:MAG: LysM peptidoglycan-binding domain-containing protein, partial [Pseudomonadota bacterium]
MRDRLLCALMSCAVTLAGVGPFGARPAAADGHSDCPVHVVAAGETLSLIAERYYGETEMFSALYALNRAVIGPNRDVIEEGQRLTLPCTGLFEERLNKDALDTGQVANTAPPPTPQPDQPVAPQGAGLTLLTGGPFVPFVDEMATGGGLFVELVSAALASANRAPLEAVFVNDRDAHLWDVMPRGGFDLAAPWFYPDCDAVQPGTRAAALCETYIASTGYYEFVTEFYARADTDWGRIVLPGGLVGARICFPDGYPTDALRVFELPTGAVTLIRGANPTDCLVRLDRMEVEVAAIEGAVTRALIDRVSVENPIVVLESLTRVDRLRVLARRDNPAARALIDRLDTALGEISENGTWFEIVNRHLRGDPPP